MTLAIEPLRELGIVEPSRCSRALLGSGCVRTCARCGLAAYDVRLRSADEVRDQIHRTERRSVYRYYQRKDGLLLTDVCPSAWRWPTWLLPYAIVFVLLALTFAGLFQDNIQHAMATPTNTWSG